MAQRSMTCTGKSRFRPLDTAHTVTPLGDWRVFCPAEDPGDKPYKLAAQTAVGKTQDKRRW